MVTSVGYFHRRATIVIRPSSLNAYYNRMKRNEENKFKEYSPTLLISCLVLSLLNTLGTFLCDTVLDVNMVHGLKAIQKRKVT